MPNPQPPAEQEREKRAEDERVRLWRWIGGGKPPGMWQIGPTPVDTGPDSEIEIDYFVPESDPFHSQDSEQKGGGADEREERLSPADATSGPDTKPLSEDEGRDSSQEPCPHGCVNGVITATDLGGEGTSHYCSIHGPDSERGEQRWTISLCECGAIRGPVKGGHVCRFDRRLEVVPATQADLLEGEQWDAIEHPCYCVWHEGEVVKPDPECPAHSVVDPCEYGCEGECRDLQHWRDRFDYVRTVLENTFDERDQLRQERDALLAEREFQHEGWRRAVLRAEAAESQLEDAGRYLNTELATITEQRDAAEANLAQAQAEVAELRERVRELEEALRSLLGSLSWDAVEYDHWTVDDDPVQEAKAVLTAQEQGEADG